MTTWHISQTLGNTERSEFYVKWTEIFGTKWGSQKGVKFYGQALSQISVMHNIALCIISECRNVGLKTRSPTLCRVRYRIPLFKVSNNRNPNLKKGVLGKTSKPMSMSSAVPVPVSCPYPCPSPCPFRCPYPCPCLCMSMTMLLFRDNMGMGITWT
jgi:hypothetical protein